MIEVDEVPNGLEQLVRRGAEIGQVTISAPREAPPPKSSERSPRGRKNERKVAAVDLGY